MNFMRRESLEITWDDLRYLIHRLLDYCYRLDESDWIYWFNVHHYVVGLLEHSYFMLEPVPELYRTAVEYIGTHVKHWTRKGFLKSCSSGLIAKLGPND